MQASKDKKEKKILNAFILSLTSIDIDSDNTKYALKQYLKKMQMNFMIEFICHKYIKIKEEMDSKFLNPTVEQGY